MQKTFACRFELLERVERRVAARSARGHIYWILSNPIYVGRLRHKGQTHVGLHPAIVDQETWERVQRQLAEQTQRRAAPHRNAESFLAGKLYDDRGNRMGPSHAAKGGRRWHYYVSRAILTGRKPDAGSVTRVPAARIEKQVFDAIKDVIASRHSTERLGALSHVGFSGRTVGSDSGRGEPHQELCTYEEVTDAIERVTIGVKEIQIRLSDVAPSMAKIEHWRFPGYGPLLTSAARSSKAKVSRALPSALCEFRRVPSSPNPCATPIAGWTN